MPAAVRGATCEVGRPAEGEAERPMRRVGAKRMSVATGPPAPLRPLRMIGDPADLTHGNRQVPNWLRALRREARLAWLLARRAVSYTHLRAHETVLDLVCRLL